ncbi:denticleless protein homolog [Watersipora subatra]|uniref:denticleless protein homolog n=1 Tax=Watersipora subatra TaxID=2589382 RepID=UPI00355B55CF
MYLTSIRHRETGTVLVNRKLPYDWLLTRFASLQKDKHLVQGDHNASPDVESVAGTVIKFSEDISNSHVLALADEDGMLYLFNTRQRGPVALIARWSVHKNAIFDLEWLPYIPRIVTASGHQIACLVDVSTQQTIDTFKGHSSSLKTIASRKTDPYVFATGGRDGCICIWDQRVARRGNLVPTSNEIKLAHSSGSRMTRKSTSQSITGLCFQDETTLISCASNDSCIKVWDLRRSYKTQKSEPQAKHKFTYHGKSLKQVGYSGLTTDHARSFIFANCIDDSIYQFSVISCQDEVVATYRCHRNKTFFVKSALSPDDNYLLTGSSDHAARIYDVRGRKKSMVYQLLGHTDEVTSVAWSRYETGKLATISDDDTLRIWRLTSNPADDVIEGTCQLLSTISSSMTGIKTRQRVSQSCTVRPLSADKGVLPWPVFKGLDIHPKVSSPKKLLISPRKSSSSFAASKTQAAVAAGTARLSLSPSNPVNQAKRRLMDNECFHPSSKRLRDDVPLSPCSPSLSSTQSPIRINNSSKIIVNITPTRAKKLNDFSSPTANLPNSVLDPQQTPKRYDKENSCSKQAADWLSQLSQEKKHKLTSPSCSTGPAVTPTRAANRGTVNSKSKTPTGSKRVVQTLMKYFSPSSSSSDNKGST